MTVKVAINGFGRIGRAIVRQLEQFPRTFQVVAINDLTDPKTLAHLLKYDSVHGSLNREVKAGDGAMSIAGRSIKILAEKDPKNLPWKALGVDLVLECTGLFTSKEKAELHIQAGAKKVIVSAPSNNADITIVYGVNHDKYDSQKHTVISCASCTTNCLAPVAKVLLENFGIKRGSMTTVHSYTNDQQILDLPHKDLRRARAAGLSMIPTSTGAAKALGLVIPELQGKLDGFAIRVPTPNVSVIDLVCELERDCGVEEINRALLAASQNSLKGVLGFCDEPLVSSDFKGDTRSSIVDSLSTMVIDKRLAKVISWYDNEIGFSARMCDLSTMVCQSIG